MSDRSTKNRSTVTEDPAKDPARFKRLGLLLKVSIGPSIFLLVYSVFYNLTFGTYLNATGTALVAVSWYLHRRRTRIELACWSFILGVSVMIIATAILGGMMRSSILWILPLVPMGSCFVLSQRSTYWCTAASTGIIFAVWMLESRGMPVREYTAGWLETGLLRVSSLFVFSIFGITAAKIADTQVQTLQLEEQKLRLSKRTAEQAKLSKSAFLATMSHEIRTPMNGILGMTEHLLNKPRTPRQREGLEMIQQCSEDLMLLLNDILDLSKLDVGKLKFDTHPFDLTRCAAQSLEAYLAAGAPPEMELINDLPARELWVLGDEKRMTQIIKALIASTIRANQGPGKVHLRIQTPPSASGHAHSSFVISLLDTRPRLTKRCSDELFETQERQKLETYPSEQRADALALALCRRLVKAMNGRIELDESSTKQTEFRVFLQLPASTPPLRHPPEPQPQVSPDDIDVKGRNVLVVDDNAINRKVAGLVLKKMGMNVQFAVDGEQAVRFSDEVRFDVILMDLRMPKLGGLEAAVCILGGQGPSQRTPIIALTANSSEEDKRACRNAGMTGYISKPFRAEQLVSQIKDTLREHAGPQAPTQRAA